MRKSCWGLVLALLIALPVRAQDAFAPDSGISAGGAVKFLYSFSPRDEDTLYDGREDFVTSLVDLRLAGRAGEHLTWNIELAASWNPDYDMGNVGNFANQNETGGAGVRQASIRIGGIVPYTTFELGTFIPHLTNYMPRRVEDLDLIQYPLMNNAVLMETGYRNAGIDLSPWQQTGFNAEIRLPYMIEIDLGMWNGMMPDREAQPDPNVAKAVSIVLTYRPAEPLALTLGHWGEDFQSDAPGLGQGVRHLNIWYGYASYLTDTLNVTADFAQGSAPEGTLTDDGDRADWRWEGAQVTVGYWFRPWFEALVRYEYFDPNTLDTLDIATSRFDRSVWWTLGTNFRLNDNAELSVNYIIKLESADPIEEGHSGKDPTLPGYDPHYSAQDNDLFLVQFQVWR